MPLFKPKPTPEAILAEMNDPAFIRYYTKEIQAMDGSPATDVRAHGERFASQVQDLQNKLTLQAEHKLLPEQITMVERLKKEYDLVNKVHDIDHTRNIAAKKVVGETGLSQRAVKNEIKQLTGQLQNNFTKLNDRQEKNSGNKHKVAPKTLDQKSDKRHKNLQADIHGKDDHTKAIAAAIALLMFIKDLLASLLKGLYNLAMGPKIEKAPPSSSPGGAGMTGVDPSGPTTGLSLSHSAKKVAEVSDKLGVSPAGLKMSVIKDKGVDGAKDDGVLGEKMPSLGSRIASVFTPTMFKKGKVAGLDEDNPAESLPSSPRKGPGLK